MHNNSSPLSEIRLYDEGLPDPLFEQFRSAVKAVGLERPNGKDTYSRTFWLPRDSTPRNVVEQAVITLQELASPPAGFTGAEWWLGRLKRGKKLSLHFDRDLALSRQTGEFVFPLLSSVFYINRYMSGPTTILDQILGDDGKSKIPKQAKISTSVSAIPNHYLVFPGNLRHGVIPDVTKIDEDHPDDLRLTLLVNYWDRRPSPPICCDFDGSVYPSLNQPIPVPKA